MNDFVLNCVGKSDYGASWVLYEMALYNLLLIIFKLISTFRAAFFALSCFAFTLFSTVCLKQYWQLYNSKSDIEEDGGNMHLHVVTSRKT